MKLFIPFSDLSKKKVAFFNLVHVKRRKSQTVLYLLNFANLCNRISSALRLTTKTTGVGCDLNNHCKKGMKFYVQ